MGGILGQKPARPHDEVDPIDERRGEIQAQFLQGSIAQTYIGVELVVRDMAMLGLALLHHRHVPNDAGLAQLVLGAASTDAPRPRQYILAERRLGQGCVRTGKSWWGP